MFFNELARWFSRLEQESSRLKITEMLSDLFKELTAQEIQIVSYFCMGVLNPPYKMVQFNIAVKSALKIAARLLDQSEYEIQQVVKDLADLGEVIKDGLWQSAETLSIFDVYKRLQSIAELSGEGSQEARVDGLVTLLREVDPLGAKYILRIVLGTLRLGFSDMTLVDALSWMLVGNKSCSKKIEAAYNRCADIGHVAFVTKTEGIEGVEHLKVILGIPIRPAAAERLSSAAAIIEKIGPCIAEPKLDGFRLQVHIDNRQADSKIHFFSRNLLNMSYMYPDLVSALQNIKAETIIMEGEAIAFDINTGNFMPFQETVKRKRKHGIDSAIEELPLQLFFFDILYLDGQELFNETLLERRAKLAGVLDSSPIDKNIIRTTEEVMVETAPELEKYFLKQIEDGLEGVVVKRPDSPYQPGKRNFNWIKLKRLEEGHLLDTIDCVILGYYYGRGKRSAFGIGAILIGLYNKTCDCFQTVAKIGTGFSDVEWRSLKKKCDDIKVTEKPKNVSCAKDLYPNVWVRPEIVIEVTADEITRSPIHTVGLKKVSVDGVGEMSEGFALRFPRFLRYRDDKNAYEATSVEEFKDLFKQQRK